jgi:hypothetical protein
MADGGGAGAMNRFVLVWEQFDTFQAALKQFKRSACLYVLTDKEERILRIGESGDLRSRYRGGTGWMVEAALHESGNKIFVAPAPADEATRRTIEAWLTFKHQPRYCQRDKLVAPVSIYPICLVTSSGGPARTIIATSTTWSKKGVRYLSLIISTLNHAPYSTLGYKLSWTLDSSSKSQSNTDLDFLVWRLR